MGEVVTIKEVSNAEFLERYARPGCIGLAGGDTLVDRVIRRAERHVCDGRWSHWSHAFLFGERRADGHLWVIESDLQMVKKHIRLGVQENRVGKYHDEKMYGTLAILDFHLPEEKVRQLLGEALELMAGSTRYSLRELFGTLFALCHPELREQENILSRKQSLYCSAFVQHVFGQAGMPLTQGIHAKNSTPEDIFQTVLPHTKYVLARPLGESKLRAAARKVRQKIRPKKKV